MRYIFLTLAVLVLCAVPVTSASLSPRRAVAEARAEWLRELRASAKNGDRAARFASPSLNLPTESDANSPYSRSAKAEAEGKEEVAAALVAKEAKEALARPAAGDLLRHILLGRALSTLKPSFARTGNRCETKKTLSTD